MRRAARKGRLAFANAISILALLQSSTARGACTVAVGNLGHSTFATLVTEDAFFVSDGFQNVLQVPKGNTSSGELAASVSGAMGMALDSAGRLLVSDSAGGRVVMGLPGAAALTSAVAGLGTPLGIVLDAQENLFVVDGGARNVQKFAKLGMSWAPQGVIVASQLSGFPLGVAIDAEGSLYIADTAHDRIVKWAAPYHSEAVLIENIMGPTGVAVDEAGFVYFSESNSHRVLALHPNSTRTSLVAGEGGVGTGPDQLNFPAGVAVADGSLYIADRYNNRIVQCPLIASTTSTTSSSSTSFTTTTVTSATKTNTPTTSTSISTTTFTTTRTRSATSSATSNTASSNGINPMTSNPLTVIASTRSTTSEAYASSTNTPHGTSALETTKMTTTDEPSTRNGTERASKEHALVLLGMIVATDTVSLEFKNAPDALMDVVPGVILDFIATSLGLHLPPSAVTIERARPGSASKRNVTDGLQALELEVKINAGDAVAPYSVITAFSEGNDDFVMAMKEKIEAVPGFKDVQILNLEVLLEQGVPHLHGFESEAARSVLPRMTNSSPFVIDSLEGGGTVVATSLHAWNQDNIGRQLSVTLPGPFQRQVSLPAQLIDDLGPDGEEIVLVVVGDNKVAATPKPWFVTAITSVSLYVSGKRVTIQNLTEPIEFTLNVAYVPGMACVYWDETHSRWSMRGVQLSSRNTVGSPVRCAVTHLTIFGVVLQGFLDAFLCSQFQLFSETALAALMEVEWLGGLGSAFSFCLCFLLCVAAIAAGIADHRSVGQYWTMDELFLLAKEPVGKTEIASTVSERELTNENSEAASRTPSLQHRCCDVLRGLCAAGRWFTARCDSSAFREVIDEVLSHWFDNFGDLRMMVEDVFSDVRAMMARGYTVRIAYRMMAALLTRSSKRFAAASMRLSLETVTFVLADKELAVVLASRFERFLRDESETRMPKGPWYSCTTREAAWAVLHARVADSVHCHMLKHRCGLRRCAEVFVMNSPLGILLTRDLFMSRLMRFWLHVTDLVGTLLITSLFYAASGTLKGKKKTRTDSACADHGLDQEMAFIMGRHLAVAIGSVLLSGLPVSLFASFITRSIHQLDPLGEDWQRRLRVWSMERRTVWILSSFYVLLSALFIALFLANLGDQDHKNWVRTSFLGIVISDAMVPLAVAIVGPSVAHVSMTVNSVVHGGSIADMREVAVKHLLQTTNIKLPGRIMV